MSLVTTGRITSLDQRVSQKYYDEYDRIFGKKPLPNEKSSVQKGNLSKDRASTLDSKESSISLMLKDKTMVRMIREGKANDRGLKREAERIERENSTRPREMFREKQKQKLQEAISELRRSQR